MEMYIKVNVKDYLSTELEFIIGKMEIYFKVNGYKTIEMDKVRLNLKMDHCLLDNLKMMIFLDLDENLPINLEINFKQLQVKIKIKSRDHLNLEN